MKLSGKQPTPSKEVKLAIEQCERIIDMTDELPEAGWDFGESVAEKCRDIWKNIEKHNRVTEGQQDALDNMEDGVSRWFSD